MKTVSVEFKKGGKQYIFYDNGFKLNVGDNVIVDTERGEQFGTVAALLNTDWWMLFVWVNDNWEILWEENDINSYWDKSWDSLLKDIEKIISTHFSEFRAFIKVDKVTLEDKEIVVFTIEKSNKAVYFTYNWREEFYIRNAASSKWLSTSDAVSYINAHFKYLG